MPAKLTVAQLESKTELELAIHRKDIESLQRELGQLELIKMRERLVAVETMLAEVKRKKEDGEKRNLQFVFIVIGAVFTIIVQLVIASVKK